LLFAGLHREGNLSSFSQMPMIWSRGEWGEEKHFCVSALDRGVLHGLAAFETMLATDGVIQHLEKHRRRLLHAVECMGLCDVSGYDFLQIGQELCEKNSCVSGRARLRLTVTAGEGALSEKGPGAGATVWMTASPLAPAAATCKVVTLPWTRNERGALAGMKTSSYAENVLGLQWARAQGADEGIFFNTHDELCEACTANVFVRLDGTWHTPSLASGCLPGVMREVLLENDPSIQESVITREQFASAEEMYLTSAIRGVVPVASCDGREF
jgi:branched-subunit amino acid aminotransferase/4-amino-4-deoxychorismate lyase